MDRIFTAISSRIAAFVGQPAAFVAALLTIFLWAGLGRCSTTPIRGSWL